MLKRPADIDELTRLAVVAYRKSASSAVGVLLLRSERTVSSKALCKTLPRKSSGTLTRIRPVAEFCYQTLWPHYLP